MLIRFFIFATLQVDDAGTFWKSLTNNLHATFMKRFRSVILSAKGRAVAMRARCGFVLTSTTWK